MNRKIGTFFVGLFALVSTVGCGGGAPADFPPLHPCSITILADGAPLEGALVGLTPDSTQPGGLSGAGQTDAKGVAVIKTQGAYDGVPAGKYKVSVRKQSREKNEDVETDAFEATSVEAREREYTIHTFIDPQYANPVNTPLTIDIVDGKNEQTFDVGPQIDETM